MKTRKSKSGLTCQCDYNDIMGFRNSDLEHFNTCPFADLNKPVFGTDLPN